MLGHLYKILFIRSDRFGEFLLSLPAIKRVKESYPDAQVALLAQGSNLELIRGCDFIDQTFVYQETYSQGYRGAWQLSRFLKKESFDACVVMNPRKEFHMATFLARVPLRVGYRRKWGFCLNKKILDQKHRALKHEITYNLDLVKLLCEVHKTPHVTIPVDGRETIEFLRDTLDLSQPLVMVHPFTSNPKKEIRREFWRQLIAPVRSLTNATIAIIGAQEEAESAKELAEELGVVTLAGRLSLRHLSTLMKECCHLFVGLDSGPMHLASMFDIPTVGLFTISNARRWGPHGLHALPISSAQSRAPKAMVDQIISFARSTGKF